jgi:hypothetical protein
MKRKVSAQANFVSSGTEPHHQPTAYLEEIEKWRDDLRDMATVTLEMLEKIGGNERERDDLNRALDSLRSIDELVKVIGELPYTHVQAHALGQLWAVIGAAFVIGSRAVKNPVSGKVQTKGAHKSITTKSQHVRDIVERCAAPFWERKPSFRDNPGGTATGIFDLVNGELPKEAQVTERVIRGHLTKLISEMKPD